MEASLEGQPWRDQVSQKACRQPPTSWTYATLGTLGTVGTETQWPTIEALFTNFISYSDLNEGLTSSFVTALLYLLQKVQDLQLDNTHLQAQEQKCLCLLHSLHQDCQTGLSAPDWKHCDCHLYWVVSLACRVQWQAWPPLPFSRDLSHPQKDFQAGISIPARAEEWAVS